MNKKTKPNNYASRYLIGLGVFLTALVVGVFLYSHFYGEVCNFFDSCVSKWDYLKAATPNEIGDTLAGYAGTLAFVWIVVTVCLQAIELREQRAEFTRMADAQGDQVGLLVKQGEIFEKEQLDRQQESTDNEIAALLDEISTFIERKIHRKFKWISVVGVGHPSYGNGGEEADLLTAFPEKDLHLDSRLYHQVKGLFRCCELICAGFAEQKYVEIPDNTEALVELAKLSAKIENRNMHASSAMQSRLRKLELLELTTAINGLVECNKAWEASRTQ